MSNQDIIREIEKILSDILSRKYDAKIVLRFGGSDIDGDIYKSETINKK